MDLMFLDRPEWRLAVAVAIGLVVGAERERRKVHPARRQTAGVRTFATAAVLGGVLAQLGSAALLCTGLAVLGLITAVGYYRGDRADPGITTEVALIATFALGAFSQQQPLPALGAGVSVSFLLAVRTPLHRAVRELISERELLDALTFAVAAVVILPLVPDRAVDPWGVINPFALWRLAVLIMAVTGVGYIALRWVGPRYGLSIAGLASGFVSSTATIGAMGARTRQAPELMPAAVAGAATSTVATFVLLGLLLTAANPSLAALAMPAIVAGGLTAAAYGAVAAHRASRTTGDAHPRGRAFRWQSAAGFVAMVALVTLGSTLLGRSLGHAGVLAAAAMAGLVDVHAAALAVATTSLGGGIDPAIAHAAVLVGISTNTLAKAAFALTSGTREFALRVIAGLVLVAAAAWVGYAVTVVRT